jgi:hypothetical protein
MRLILQCRYCVPTQSTGTQFYVAGPRWRGGYQAPSLLQRCQVEGAGGEEDQAAFQAKNRKIHFFTIRVLLMRCAFAKL